jgi:putative transcriptional regulator
MKSKTVQFHPSDDQLIEFSAGVLPMSRALCIAAHVEHCHICEKRLSNLQQLGSAQMESLSPQKISADLKNSILSKLHTQPQDQSLTPAADNLKTPNTQLSSHDNRVSAKKSVVPKCLEKWVPESFDNLPWQSIAPNVSISELCSEGSGAKAALVKVKAGGSMAHHSHTGDEVTVILEGSFSDEDGCYKPGDFIFRDSGHKHKPVATNDQDCICLIVLDGPIQLTGWIARLFNPFLRFKHKTPALV